MALAVLAVVWLVGALANNVSVVNWVTIAFADIGTWLSRLFQSISLAGSGLSKEEIMAAGSLGQTGGAQSGTGGAESGARGIDDAGIRGGGGSGGGRPNISALDRITFSQSQLTVGRFLLSPSSAGRGRRSLCTQNSVTGILNALTQRECAGMVSRWLQDVSVTNMTNQNAGLMG